MSMRDRCPVRVFEGADLTGMLIDDYRPYIKDGSVADLERTVRELAEDEGGPVTRAEYFGFADGAEGYHTKWYWFGGSYDPECPHMELTNAMAGVERFPER